MSHIIISKKHLVNSFERAIDSFLELYTIQNSKSTVSSAITSVYNSVKLINNRQVRIVEISSIEAEKANNIKRELDRLSSFSTAGLSDEDDKDEELFRFFKAFGHRLAEIAKNGGKRRYLTSYYSFIVLYTYHNALHKDDSGFDYIIKDLLISYLTPKLRNDEIHKKLFDIVAEALKKIDKDQFKLKDSSGLSELDFLDKQDKILAFLLSKENLVQPRNEYLANLFFSKDEIEKYQKIATALKKEKKFIKKKKDSDHLNFTMLIIERINNICLGIDEYINKFAFNTSLDGLQDKTESFFQVNTSLFIRFNVGGLDPAPMESVSKVIGNMVGQLSLMIIKSKGYGIYNRHGITGQIRASLLKFYIEIILCYIKNKIDVSIESSSESEIFDFFNSYENAVEVLPNKRSIGSLYHCLRRYYVYQDEQKDYRQKYVQEWKNAKFRKIYKYDTGNNG